MSFKFGAKSEKKLAGVYPPLVRVARRAIEISEVDFGIVQGVRTQDEQDELYTQGRTTEEIRKAGIKNLVGKPHMAKVTWTRNSNHLPKSDGYGHAIDVGAYLNGVYQNGDTAAEQALYPKIAEAMKKAAKELGISIKWGPDIGLKTDLGHYEA